MIQAANNTNASVETDFPDWIDRARCGDEIAWERLFESYGKYFKLLARVQIGRRLQSKVDDSDIVQETFLDAHRQIGNFRGQSERELLAWLRRILAGQIALMLRRHLGVQGRDVNLERELVGQLDLSSQTLSGQLVATCGTPSQNAMRGEQAVLLAEALSRLPENYREVIVLRHLEGLSFAETAQRMGRSEDSVQKLWVRGLAALRQAMKDTR